ncbi:hypothetical protein [Chryseobacterium oryzae]|uniref:Uncharacterized protein n=1 Tax=Chryseobacterium oryzae TaxID=2929799 RepID=A0ABY4BN72_9FLAO|nr:hypothetical protein [Chryseobacterium oryzae]UOE39692.1 hypothetical protein MTP08_14690 [Chryseobacterium oryzae]
MKKNKMNQNFVSEFQEFLEERQLLNYSYSNFFKREFSLKKTELIKYIRNSNFERVDFLWKILLFSVSSKFLYNFSKENYRLICDYYCDVYNCEDQILRYVFRYKLKSLDELAEGLSAENYRLYYNHCHSKVDDYAEFFVSIFYKIDQNLFNVNSSQKLKRHFEDDYFKEEFSDKGGDLTNEIFKALENKLKHMQHEKIF